MTQIIIIMTCRISGLISEFIFLLGTGGLGSVLIPFDSSSSLTPGLPHAAHIEGQPHGPRGHKFGVPGARVFLSCRLILLPDYQTLL